MSNLTERISCKIDAGAYSHTNDVSALVIALEEAERDLAAARAEVERLDKYACDLSDNWTKAEAEAARLLERFEYVLHNAGLINDLARSWNPEKHPPLIDWIRASVEAALEGER